MILGNNEDDNLQRTAMIGIQLSQGLREEYMEGKNIAYLRGLHDKYFAQAKKLEKYYSRLTDEDDRREFTKRIGRCATLLKNIEPVLKTQNPTIEELTLVFPTLGKLHADLSGMENSISIILGESIE